jgi:hypothetical protein
MNAAEEKLWKAREDATHALWKTFKAFRATLPDKKFADLGMRATEFTVPVGVTKYGHCVELRVVEISDRHDLWAIVQPATDRPVWSEREGRFVAIKFAVDWITTYDPLAFNLLPVIMSRLPQAIAFERKRCQIKDPKPRATTKRKS